MLLPFRIDTFGRKRTFRGFSMRVRWPDRLAGAAYLVIVDSDFAFIFFLVNRLCLWLSF